MPFDPNKSKPVQASGFDPAKSRPVGQPTPPPELESGEMSVGQNPAPVRPLGPPGMFGEQSAPTPATPPGIMGEKAVAAVNAASELMAAANRGATRLADFLTTDQINAISALAGSDLRVPGVTEALSPATQGNFMEEGLPRDVVRGAGEVVPAAVTGGAALTQAAARLPASFAGNASRTAAATVPGARTAAAPVIAPTEGVAAGSVRQLGSAAPAADAAYGSASGVGAEVGREYGGETGATVGAFAAPLSIASFKSLLGGVFNMGRNAVENFTRSVDDMGEEGMARLLVEAMDREGMDPDQVAKRLAELGPEAVPADVGDGFMRLLRLAISKQPRIGGESHRVLDPRHAAQGDRIVAAFEQSTGILPNASLDDVIVRLEKVMGPKIDELYSAARAKSEQVLGGPRPGSGYSFGSPHLQEKPSKLQQLLDGANIGGSATKKAELELTAKRLSGEPVTKLDRIDATKRALDDQIKASIRNGEMGKARSYLKLKNQLVTQADAVIPEYKQARNLFAGKAELESAADLGKEFFKMEARDLLASIRTMGKSERLMFRMGARQAILDQLDKMQVSRDSVKALFGRGGDVKKLRAVFPNKESFDQFANAMEREAYFVMTRRAAQSNSTTFQQFSDGQSFQEAMDGAAAITGDPAAAANFVMRTLQKLSGDRSSEAFTSALEQAGDVLLERGMNPERIIHILRSGKPEKVKEALRRALPQVPGAAFRNALGGAAVESTPRTSDKWGLTITGDAG